MISHISIVELSWLGLLEIAKFTVGDTVIGTVRSIQDYGIFVELTPNLSGLEPAYQGTLFCTPSELLFWITL